MIWNDLQQDWPALIPAMQARWPGLAEDDLIALSGTRPEVIRAVADATGDTPAEAERQIEVWMQGPMPADAFAHPTHDNAATAEAKRYIAPGEDALADDERFGDDDQADRPMGRSAG